MEPSVIKRRWPLILGIILLLAMAAGGSPLPQVTAMAPSAAADLQIVGKIRWAYYVTYGNDSMDSLRQHISNLDILSPYWYELNAQGEVSRVSGASDQNLATVRDLAQGAGVKLLPMIKNRAEWGELHPILADPSLRRQTIANIVALTANGAYPGIHIDFESVNSDDRPHLTTFMNELAAELRPRGKLVTQAVAAKDRERTDGWAGAYDYAALGAANDLILIMTYGYGTAIPRSTAPFPWVDDSAAFAASQIPPDKLLLGVPWYGYEWVDGRVARSLRYPQAIALAQEHGVDIEYDQSAEGPHFTFQDGGQRHDVWFEDRRSQDAKLDLVQKYGLAGAGGWRLGHEDPGVWDSFNAMLGFRTWYLAEGSTGNPYHTWVLLMNPNAGPANATVTFMKEDGSTVVRQYRLPAQSRTNVFANQIVPDSAISTKVEADQPIIVERAMYFGHDGHASVGVNAPRYRWYLPEGYAGSGVHSWVLLMNPNPQAANATVTFMKEDGSTVVRQYSLAATSRLNIFANQVVPGAAFATKVESDAPIVAERAMYFDGGKGGHGSPGSPFATKNWYFAEGYTGYGSWILLMNPGATPTPVAVTFLLEDGRAVRRDYSLPGTSRLTVYANSILGPDKAFATKIEAQAPIVAERSMYWNQSQSGHASLGAPAPARTWYLAEGATAYPFDEWLLVANPNPSPANLTVTFMKEGGGAVVRSYRVGASARFTLHVNEVVPDSALSIKVESDLAVVAERSMYFGQGGTVTIGVAR